MFTVDLCCRVDPYVGFNTVSGEITYDIVDMMRYFSVNDLGLCAQLLFRKSNVLSVVCRYNSIMCVFKRGFWIVSKYG